MEACYTELQENGRNDVENLIRWLKNSQVIDQSKEQEDKVRWYFTQNIPFDKFKEVIEILADEFDISLDEITQKLADTCPKSGCHGPCTRPNNCCEKKS